MDRQHTQQGELDKVGTNLIASSALSESDIDRIAESPLLYSGVRARINSGATSQKRATSFGRQLALGFGTLLIVVGIGAAGLVMLRSGNSETAERLMPDNPSAETFRDPKGDVF